MLQILNSIKKEETEKNEEVATNLQELKQQKQRIEEKIKRFDRKQIDDKIKESLMKLEDISDSVSDIQNALNTVWKRTKQIEEELKEALAMPS